MTEYETQVLDAVQRAANTLYSILDDFDQLLLSFRLYIAPFVPVFLILIFAVLVLKWISRW